MPMEIVLTTPKLTGMNKLSGIVKPSISLSIAPKNGALSRYDAQFGPEPGAGPDVGPPQLMLDADIGVVVPGTRA